MSHPVESQDAQPMLAQMLFSRLYRIGGTSGSSKAFLLCAHLDVVPPGEVDEWEMEPFGTGSVMTDDGSKVRGITTF